jgi:hypothetical protein
MDEATLLVGNDAVHGEPTRWTAMGQRPGAEVPAGAGVAAGDQGKPSGLR